MHKPVIGPQSTVAGGSEADVFTRWDTHRKIPALLPSELELVDYVGVRVVTPFAELHRVPVVATALRWAETESRGFAVSLLRRLLDARRAQAWPHHKS